MLLTTQRKHEAACLAAEQRTYLPSSRFGALLVLVPGTQKFCSHEQPDGMPLVSPVQLRQRSARSAGGSGLLPRPAQGQDPDGAERRAKQSDITTGRASLKCSVPWVLLWPNRPA